MLQPSLSRNRDLTALLGGDSRRSPQRRRARAPGSARCAPMGFRSPPSDGCTRVPLRRFTVPENVERGNDTISISQYARLVKRARQHPNCPFPRPHSRGFARFAVSGYPIRVDSRFRQFVGRLSIAADRGARAGMGAFRRPQGSPRPLGSISHSCAFVLFVDCGYPIRGTRRVANATLAARVHPNRTRGQRQRRRDDKHYQPHRRRATRARVARCR